MYLPVNQTRFQSSTLLVSIDSILGNLVQEVNYAIAYRYLILRFFASQTIERDALSSDPQTNQWDSL